jgi:hypothetical protein
LPESFSNIQLSGTPTNSGDFSFTLHLADSVGNQTGDAANPDKVYTLHVSDTLAVTTTGLPTAALNTPYSATLTSSGGFKPIVWRVAAGTLPVGITLDTATGQLSGTPTGASASVTFEASDSDAPKQTAAKQMTITVSSTLTVIETTLPDARSASAYSTNIRAQFGTAPYSWKISAGTLPAGIILTSTSSNATLSGMATTAGTSTFTVEVSDSSATPQKITRDFTLTVQGGLTIATTDLPALTSGQPYTTTIAVSGGANPYTFGVTTGSLPAGIFLNSASGVISGTSTTTGGSSFTITVSDSGVPAQSVSQAYSLAALVSVPVSKSAPAAGTLASVPPGIVCDASCTSSSAAFAAGKTVIISATPAAGYFLAGWNGCDSSSGTECTITVRDGLASITASFSRQMATGLTSGPPVTSIKQNAIVTLSGVLGTIPASTGAYLNGKTITVTLTKPDGTKSDFSTTTSDTSGSWTLPIPAVFTAPGTYLASATFAGSTELITTSSSTATILMDKSAGYAIIVTGKRNDNSLLDLHTTSADAIISTLKKRGFLDSNINILKSSTSTAISKADLQTAITSWAKDKLAASAAPLYLIMIDHGSPTGFVMGDETLTPDNLNGYLDTLEADPSVISAINSYKRFIIIGSCYSGQFIKAVSKPGRIVITSAGADEESIAGVKLYDITSKSLFTGGEYFLDSLFTFLGRGDDFKDSFTHAAGSLPARDVRRITNGYHSGVWDALAQHPLLDDNGDKTGSYQLGGSDGILAAALKLGEGIQTNAGDNPADIKTVTLQTSLDTSSTSTALWLQANLDARVGSAWVEIRTPETTASGAGSGGQVIINLTTVPLTHNAATGRWETNWNGFTKEGRYDIFYYTTDIQTGEQSVPAQSTVYKNKMNNSAPSAFDLVSPGDLSTTNQTFGATWQESADTDGVTYTLQIATDQAFSNIVSSEQDIPQAFTLIPETVLQNRAVPGTYLCQNGDSSCYWRVQAIDSFGATTTSTSTRSFTIVITNGLPSVIKGYIRSETGSPIPGATISIGAPQVTSLANGAFLLMTSPGSYTLSATASGYQQKSIANLSTTPGKVFDASLTLAAVISTATKPGDCDNSGTVTIAEVQSAINMFLGLKTVEACVNQDGVGGVSIAEVQKTINSFLGL